MSPPEIAVVIPCFELGHTLGEALESALVQTRPASEIVVVDDGSEDVHTRQILQQIAGPLVRVCIQEHAGVAAARNRGATLTSAPYLVFLDADDRLDARYLEKAAARLDAEPALDFVSCGLESFGEGRGVWIPPPCTLAEQLAFGSVHVSSLLRRRLWRAVGGFDETLPAHEDWDFWVRAVARGFRGEVLEEPLVHYRVRSGSRYQRGLGAEVFAASMGHIAAKHADALVERASDVIVSNRASLQTQRRHREHLEDLLRAQREELADVERGIAAAGARLVASGQSSVGWGDLRRVQPFSDAWGLERGLPVDRFYIERFLRLQRSAIRGRVLEIKDDGYTRMFGGEAVEHCEVLDIDAANPRATWIADLTRESGVPARFDCFILTQTLHILYDFRAALRNAWRWLKPGGTLLCTLPALSPISDEDRGEADSDFWRFTEAAVRRVLSEFFELDQFDVTTCGNLQTGIAFLQGLGAEELDPVQLERADPDFPLLFCVRARKSKDPECKPKDPECKSKDRGRRSGGRARNAGASARPAGAAILAYHRIAELDPDPHGLCLPAQEFRAQLAHLAAHYRLMPLADLVRASQAGQLPERAVALSFDDGYLDALETASPILEEFAAPATFFVNTERLGEPHETWECLLERVLLATPALPDTLALEVAGQLLELPTRSPAERGEAWRKLLERAFAASAAEREQLTRDITAWLGRELAPRNSHRLMTAEEVLRLSRRPGHQIGSHTRHHLCLPAQPARIRAAEIAASRRSLEALLGQSVELVAYPYGMCDADTAAQVRAQGLLAAVGIEPGLVRPGGDRFCLPRLEIRSGPFEDFVSQLHGSFARPLD